MCKGAIKSRSPYIFSCLQWTIDLGVARASYFRRYDLDLISKPAIPLMKSWGGGGGGRRMTRVSCSAFPMLVDVRGSVCSISRFPTFVDRKRLGKMIRVINTPAKIRTLEQHQLCRNLVLDTTGTIFIHSVCSTIVRGEKISSTYGLYIVHALGRPRSLADACDHSMSVYQSVLSLLARITPVRSSLIENVRSTRSKFWLTCPILPRLPPSTPHSFFMSRASYSLFSRSS